MKTKECKKCNETKPIERFNLRKDSGKYRNECKECLAAANKAYREKRKKNGGKKLTKQHDQSGDTIKCLDCGETKPKSDFTLRPSGRYRNRCKPCKLTYLNKYRRTNEEYKERYNKYRSERRKTDPKYAMIERLRARLGNWFRHNRKKGINAKKHKKTYDLLGCDFKTFKEHIISNFYGDMDWDKMNFVLDHRVPCAWFDPSIPKHLEMCFNYKNIYPMTDTDNAIKSDRVWVEYDLSKNPYI